MSYSTSVPAGPLATLEARIDEAIDALQEGPGKDEAIQHRTALVFTATELHGLVRGTEDDDCDNVRFSISGHGSGTNTQCTVSAYREATTEG